MCPQRTFVYVCAGMRTWVCGCVHVHVCRHACVRACIRECVGRREARSSTTKLPLVLIDTSCGVLKLAHVPLPSIRPDSCTVLPARISVAPVDI